MGHVAAGAALVEQAGTEGANHVDPDSLLYDDSRVASMMFNVANCKLKKGQVARRISLGNPDIFYECCRLKERRMTQTLAIRHLGDRKLPWFQGKPIHFQPDNTPRVQPAGHGTQRIHGRIGMIHGS